eukprot:TRINITY_DN20901_c0_g1_i1.p1 TRINITY_DN20901_c0_g1~~TRINITY_DN20901_c0_g1_i1.p1  ORF type:complete len:629 (+),score=179.91 TRINITY_DN20901_c0_g1_i1:131-2017(+)
MPKKPAPATVADVDVAKEELRVEYRAELDSRVNLLAQGRATMADIASAKEQLRAEFEAASNAHCAELITKMKQEIVDSFQSSLQSTEEALRKELSERFSQEVSDVKGYFLVELAATTRHIMLEAERKSSEKAEGMIRKQEEEMAVSLEDLRTQALEAQAEASEALAAAVKQVQDRTEQRLLEEEDAQESLRQHVHASDESQRASADRASESLARLQEDMKRLEESMGACQAAVSVAENAPTRRVEWVVQDAVRRMREQEQVEAQSGTNKLVPYPGAYATWFSPRFHAAGARDLQLELRFFGSVKTSNRQSCESRKGCTSPLEQAQAAVRKEHDADSHNNQEQGRGDLAIFLWARKGASLVYRLNVGSKNQSFESTFDGAFPCGTGRFCVLADEVDENGNLNIAVDIMESFMRTEVVVPPRPKSSHNVQKSGYHAAAGALVLHQHINHRAVEQVKAQMDQFRSRMIRQVEWRLPKASTLKKKFTPGESLQSNEFDAAGLSGLQLIFYPCGLDESAAGFCSLFLSAPVGASLKCCLQAGKERRELCHYFQRLGCFGRTNFCRLDSCVDKDTDSICIRLEVERAHQDLTSPQTPCKRSQSPKGALVQQGGPASPVAGVMHLQCISTSTSFD